MKKLMVVLSILSVTMVALYFYTRDNVKYAPEYQDYPRIIEKDGRQVINRLDPGQSVIVRIVPDGSMTIIDPKTP